jgi:hypothetical protein
MTKDSNQGIARHRAEEQPTDKDRAQNVHRSDPNKSVSREATRDPRLSDAEKTPGSGMTPDDSGDAPSG